MNTRVLYVDGTSMEANANKFTFVWKKTALKTKNKLLDKIPEVINELEGLTGKKFCGNYEDTEDLAAYTVTIYLWCTDHDIRFVSGKGHRRTVVQRAYDSLKEFKEKLSECQLRIDTCGEDRNSYSKTDHDATYMHMKYDYYNNTGVFKPGYNVQLGEKERYDGMPGIVVADAGYGSYDNYMYCQENGIDAYIKYPNFRNEKTTKYKKNPFHHDRLLKENNGKLLCPQGREFIHQKDRLNTNTEYGCVSQVWQCKTCKRCPLKKRCTKAEKRSITFSPSLEEMKKKARERLDSEAGVQLRQQRCIQAEGTVGVIKNDWKYARFHRRGIENVENEMILICIGFDLMKYHQKKMRARLS